MLDVARFEPLGQFGIGISALIADSVVLLPYQFIALQAVVLIDARVNEAADHAVDNLHAHHFLAVLLFGGYRFAGWDDGVLEEQRTVTVTADATYTALFESNVGIEEVAAEGYKVSIRNGRIVVEGVAEEEVQIYDLSGRRHLIGEQLPAGAYLVRIGNQIVKKVVVIR